jgi:hypothetical protein
MAPEGLYRPVTFASNNNARRARQRVYGFLFMVAGVCLVAFSGKAGTGRETHNLIVAGVCAAALGVLSVLINRPRCTMIDAEGISTSVLWGRRTCRWADVTDVELNTDADGGTSTAYSIIVHRHDGYAFELVAPTDYATGGRHRNPDFQAQLALINSYWLNGAGPPSQGRARS